MKITDLVAKTVNIGFSSGTNSFKLISDTVGLGYTYIDFKNNTNNGVLYDGRILAQRNATTSQGNSIMEYYGASHDFYSGRYENRTRGPVTTGALTAIGTITANTFNSTSDIRFKNIIRYITVEETLNFIDNTNPILFKWKDNNENIVAGYIAQEVIKTQADHLVYTGDNVKMKKSLDGPEGKQYYLNYDGIIPYHGVAIKHILEENRQLKEEMIQMKKETSDLKEEMIQMKKETSDLKEEMRELRLLIKEINKSIK